MRYATRFRSISCSKAASILYYLIWVNFVYSILFVMIHYQLIEIHNFSIFTETTVKSLTA